MNLPDIHDMRSIASADLATLAHNALEELDRRTIEEKEKRWSKLTKEIQSYINDFGPITININGVETTMDLTDDFSYENAIIIEIEDE